MHTAIDWIFWFAFDLLKLGCAMIVIVPVLCLALLLVGLTASFIHDQWPKRKCR